MAELGIETGTVKEELLMELWYKGSIPGVIVDLGIVDLCNTSEFRRVKAGSEDFKGLPLGSLSHYSSTEESLLDHEYKAHGAEDLVFVDSPLAGPILLEENMLEISPIGGSYHGEQTLSDEDITSFLKKFGLSQEDIDPEEDK